MGNAGGTCNQMALSRMCKAALKAIWEGIICHVSQNLTIIPIFLKSPTELEDFGIWNSRMARIINMLTLRALENKVVQNKF